jgi:hypothetical protein
MGHRIIGRARTIVVRAHDCARALAVRARGRARAIAVRARDCARALTLRTRGCAGQGTVEYVALILLVAGLFATVVVAAGGVKGDGIAHAITEKIKSTIDSVGAKS